MPVSVDTSSALVAGAALDAGAVLVNDVTAGRGDPDLLPLVAERGAAVCLVHMRGTPRTMQADPRYGDVVAEVRDHLEERLRAAEDAGVPRERVVLDPGIGFGKTLAHNLALLAGVPAFAALGAPVLVGGVAEGDDRRADRPGGAGSGWPARSAPASPPSPAARRCSGCTTCARRRTPSTVWRAVQGVGG